jgi:hypothetical protein
MKRIGIAIAALAVMSSAHAVILLDDFNGGGVIGSTSVTAYNAQVLAPGNTRLLTVNVNSNPLVRPARFEVSGGNLFYETGTNMNTQLSVNYFASLTSGTPLSGTGTLTLGQMNPFSPVLNLSSESAFKIDYINNDQTTTGLFVYAWNNNFTQFVSTPAVSTVVGSGSAIIPFSSLFNANVTANNIGMIGFGVLAPNGNDITITQWSAVPEPGTMLALGAGLAALAARRRRKSA